MTADNEIKNAGKDKGSKTKLEKGSWIATIAAFIVAIVAYLVDRNDFLAFCRKFIATPFLSVWSFFSHPVTWPVWALVLLVILVLAIVGAVIVFFLWRASKESPQTPVSAPITYQDYRSDEIFEVRWSWRYLYGELNGDTLTAYCPRKDCMHRLECRVHRLLDANSSMLTGLVATDSLFCPRCGFRQDLNTDFQHQKRKVVLEIERLVNTGEFRQRMAQ